MNTAFASKPKRSRQYNLHVKVTIVVYFQAAYLGQRYGKVAPYTVIYIVPTGQWLDLKIEPEQLLLCI